MEPFTIAHIAFFASLALIGYSYVGYPAVLWILDRLTGEEKATPADPAVWPDVSVVIAAHNEELVIGRRVENLLGLDYPPERLQIMIGSDGSTDRTSEIVRSYGRRIVFHDFALQRGKAHVLNDLVALARGKFVVFTDANTFFEPDAVKELIRGFGRSRSACAVVGKLEFRTADGRVNPDGLYWLYETIVKTLESSFGTVLGANGAIYAVIRARYCALPAGTIVDDFLIPMLIRMERGGTVIFRPTAKAWELVPQTVHDEFRRRVRIGAGDAHALRHTWRLLLPGHGMLALSYWSHKILRWMGPPLLFTAFAANLWLIDYAWARATFLAQLALYALGCASPWFRRVPGLGKIATSVWYFMVINAALFLGTLKYMTGRAAPMWQPTSRTAELMSRLGTPPARAKAAASSREDSRAA